MDIYGYDPDMAFDQKIRDEVGKTKVSVSIIGDAFADVFCHLSLNIRLPSANALPPGGDLRIRRPMLPTPGGSGLNTATHLQSVVNQFDLSTERSDIMDITLQTVINENDEYGKLISRHAKKYGFHLINCYSEDVRNRNEENGSFDTSSFEANHTENLSVSSESDSQHGATVPPSTGHCIVVVNQGERSFLTHLGVMSTFKASDTILHELVSCRSADPTYTNHHQHMHIAGYYNIPGFWDGRLKRRLNLVREKRRNKSHGLNVYTTTTSLVPQYDATEDWDGQLMDLLPLVDFLILNSLEARKISNIVIDEKNCGTALNRAVVFRNIAKFFKVRCPHTYIIVTLGKYGAVALYGGEIIISADCPVVHDDPVDPTGAGDAFAAGFIKGVMNWRSERFHYQCSEIGSENQGDGSWTQAVMRGISWGCAVGTACVMEPSASLPASKAIIGEYMKVSGDLRDGKGHSINGNEENVVPPQNLLDKNQHLSLSPKKRGTAKSNLRRPIVFCGPSGAGKDALMNMLKKRYSEKQFGSVVRHTTRRPREGEVDGVDFYFTSVEKMQREIQNGNVVEYIEIFGNYYGTSCAELKAKQEQGKICLLDVDVKGVKRIKESSLDPYFVFVAPPSIESIEFRLRMNGTENEEDIQRRLANATKELEYGSVDGNFDDLFVNDDLQATFTSLVRQFEGWFPDLAIPDNNDGAGLDLSASTGRVLSEICN